MILKPSTISPNNLSINGTSPITFSWKQTGDRQTSYRLLINKNSDNSLIYDSTKLSSLNNFHILTANTLTNGVQYKYTITNWNSLDESATSDWILLKASSTPTVSFTNLIDNAEILNSAYTLTGAYSQLESVAIKTWQILLYDSSNNLLSYSPITFNNIIEYEFAGLTNNTGYSAEIQVVSQDNLLASTGKIHFTVRYETPKSAIALEAINKSNLGATELRWNVFQIIGQGDNFTYEDNDKVNVLNGKVWFDDGFSISNDFTLEVWLESITDTIFNINTNSQLVSYQNTPTDTTIVWLENSEQVLEKPLTVAISSIAPTDTNNYFWIDNPTQIVAQTLTVVQDITQPTSTNSLWIDLIDDASNTTELLRMKNSTNEDISISYYNGSFHLFKNGNLIQSLVISSSKYHLYIQQIGENLSLFAESTL